MGGGKLQAPPLQHLWEVTAATHLRTGWPEEHRVAATLSWGRRGMRIKGCRNREKDKSSSTSGLF